MKVQLTNVGLKKMFRISVSVLLAFSLFSTLIIPNVKASEASTLIHIKNATLEQNHITGETFLHYDIGYGFIDFRITSNGDVITTGTNISPSYNDMVDKYFEGTPSHISSTTTPFIKSYMGLAEMGYRLEAQLLYSYLTTELIAFGLNPLAVEAIIAQLVEEYVYYHMNYWVEGVIGKMRETSMTAQEAVANGMFINVENPGMYGIAIKTYTNSFSSVNNLFMKLDELFNIMKEKNQMTGELLQKRAEERQEQYSLAGQASTKINIAYNAVTNVEDGKSYQFYYDEAKYYVERVTDVNERAELDSHLANLKIIYDDLANKYNAYYANKRVIEAEKYPVDTSYYREVLTNTATKYVMELSDSVYKDHLLLKIKGLNLENHVFHAEQMVLRAEKMRSSSSKKYALNYLNNMIDEVDKSEWYNRLNAIKLLY